MYGLLAKAGATVVTGLVGVSAYEVLKKALGKAPVRRAAARPLRGVATTCTEGGCARCPLIGPNSRSRTASRR